MARYDCSQPSRFWPPARALIEWRFGVRLDRAIFDDGNAVLRVVVAVADADILLLARARHADLPHRGSRLRVLDLAFGRVVVARSITGAAEVQRVLAVADVNVAGAAGGAAVAAEVER